MTVWLSGPWADAELLAAITGERVSIASGDGAVVSARLGAASRERLLFHARVHAAAVAEGDGGLTIAPGDTPLSGHRFDRGPTRAHWQAIWREAADEIMDCLGHQAPERVRARLTMIWARAESRLRARTAKRPAPGGLDAANLRIHAVETPYAGFFLLRDYVYSHDLFDGGDSGELARAVFVMADAVTVLPWDPVRDRVLLIEQVRASPIGRGDPSPWLLEPVAGRIDPGDTPESTAHREAAEEARLELSDLHKVGEYYPTTGAVSEYIYSFVGIADLPDGAGRIGGLETEGEDIRGHVMERSEMMAMIAAGHAPVGPLLISAFWLETHADRLRRGG